MALILIVDDNPDICFVVTAALKDAGYECQEARSIREGLQQIAANRPALVVLDLYLPDGNGLELCRHVSQDDRIPVVVLSGTLMTEEIEALKAGAARFLRKPVRMEDLIETVRETLAVNQKRRKGDRP